MNSNIIKDTKDYPHLFNWTGSIPQKDLNDWFYKEGYIIPSYLKNLWKELGGGDMFESETILYPSKNNRLGDDISSFNKGHYILGMSYIYLIFHTGICISSIRLSDGKVVILGNTYQELQVFNNLNDWYLKIIRSEYQECYRLKGI